MIELFRGQARRRWLEEDKRRLVAETFGPGATVHGVARRHGVSPSQLFAWRKLYRVGVERAVLAPEVPGFTAVEIAPMPPPSVADVVPAASGLIEIELVGGDRVRISGAADPAVVAAALRALAGR